MHHPALLSAALFSVPELPKLLNELGYLPGPNGYDDLKHKFQSRIGSKAPHKRTVEKMLLRNELVKFTSCLGIVQLINLEREQKQLNLLVVDQYIIGHDYFILNIDKIILKIRREKKKKQKYIIADVTRKSELHSPLVKALLKLGKRDTEENCQKILTAIKDLYGADGQISNEPTKGMVEKTKNKLVIRTDIVKESAVPPKKRASAGTGPRPPNPKPPKTPKEAINPKNRFKRA